MNTKKTAATIDYDEVRRVSRQLEGLRTYSDEGKELGRVFLQLEAAFTDLRSFTDKHGNRCKCEVCTHYYGPNVMELLRGFAIVGSTLVGEVEAYEIHQVAPGIRGRDADERL